MADSAALDEILLCNDDTEKVYAPEAEYQTFPTRGDPRNARRSSIPRQTRYFGLFSYLSEDLKATVLSYVADAPFESITEIHNYSQSNLTHALPAVNRQFRTLCNDGKLFWKDAIVRMVQQEPGLWKSALNSVLLGSSCIDDIQEDPETMEELVERAHQAVLKHQPSSCYKSLYKTIVNQHLRYKGPLFFMPGQIALGQEYALHLFEPRYRLLIAQIMRHQPVEARNGGVLDTPDVYFLHANRSPLQPTTPAVLVKVRQCQIYPDGRADVVLMPIHYVWLERIWVRPDQGHLYYAQALKMGRAITQQMNHLQRQEALANVMDRLASELAQSSGSEEDVSGNSSNSESD